MDVSCCVPSRPIRRQVCAASDDLYIPSPSPSKKELRSPVPTYITLGSDGATSMAPMDETLLTESKIGYHVSPALVVFQTPPFGVRSEERRVGKECRSRWS